MGQFPLSWAIVRGGLEAVKLLLDDPDIPDEVNAAEHYSLCAANIHCICHKQHMYMYVHVFSALQEFQS